jgi:hypothetical protein
MKTNILIIIYTMVIIYVIFNVIPEKYKNYIIK